MQSTIFDPTVATARTLPDEETPGGWYGVVAFRDAKANGLSIHTTPAAAHAIADAFNAAMAAEKDAAA